MKRSTLLGLFGMLLLAATAAWADYPAERKAALELVKAGKHEEALAAFEKMAAAATSNVQKADALEQAAMCAVQLKQPDRAMEIAGRIPIEANATMVQMRLMTGARKYQEVVDKWGSLDVSNWPDAVAAEALWYRGRCHSALRKGDAAEADLKLAMDMIPEGYMRGQVAMSRAENLLNVVKDQDKALAAYVELQDIEIKRDRWGWMYLTAITQTAAIQRGLGKLDDAQATLDKVDHTTMKSGHWATQMRMARAEVLAARGETDKAIAMFEETLTSAGPAEHQKTAIQKRIDELKAAKK